MLWAMLYNQPVNTYYYLLDYLVSVAKKKPDDKSEIVVGGIITFIARKMGVGEENGINKIEGNIRLKLDTFTSMLIIRPYGPSQMYQYELRLPRANFMFILPNLLGLIRGWRKICFMMVVTHKYNMMMVVMRSKVHTSIMTRCTISKKPVSMTTIGGHGCKPKFQG